MIFRDRRDAGRQLGARLQGLVAQHPVVVGLTRGGVPVAAEVARALQAPLDVLVVRKLGCPWRPELGLGAIGEQDARVLNDRLIAELGIDEATLDAVETRERGELERRVRAYRGGESPVDLRDRTVIIVDDGVATGSTAQTAIEVVRWRGAARVILAVPVAPRHTVHELAQVADQVVCLHGSAAFWAVGQFYTDFTQVGDQEVTDELATARRAAGPSASARPVANHVDVADDPPARPARNVRAQELADLRLVPLGNALFTRESFEAAYGSPAVVGAPEHIDLRGREPAWRCIYCDADRFTTETYATDRPGVHVEFWWCELCGLGHAVSWGATDTVSGSKEGHHAHGRHAMVRSPVR